MKLEAKARLLAKDTVGGYPVEHELNLNIKFSNSDIYKTVINMLAAAQWNCAVGHSGTVAAFFDGDGSDKIEIEGLPENDGADMANAASSYGDGLMMHIGPSSAMAYNDIYSDDGAIKGYKSTKVWPTLEVDGSVVQAVAGDPGVGSTQSEQWVVPEAVEDHESDLLVDPTQQNLDVQDKMEPPVALVNGTDLEVLLEPMENVDMDTNQKTWESP